MGRRRISSNAMIRRRPVQWVVATNGYGATLAATHNVARTDILVGATSVAADFDPPLMNRFTVMAVRGTINYEVGIGAALVSTNWRFGLIVTKAGSSGASPANFDPASQPDADAPWLWLGGANWSAAPLATTNGAIAGYMSIEVNCKVKRIIRPDERLVLVANQANTASATISYTPWLRTLIARSA